MYSVVSVTRALEAACRGKRTGEVASRAACLGVPHADSLYKPVSQYYVESNAYVYHTALANLSLIAHLAIDRAGPLARGPCSP